MVNLSGKVALVTGATSGIGKATAYELARMGATTVIIGRNPDKVQQTIEEIRQSTGQQVDGIIADLSLMSQVRTAAEQFKSKYDRLDILVNNAAMGAAEYQLTSEGFEKMFALNHLSYFLLTNLLLDRIKASAPARIINLSSSVHQQANLTFDDLQSEHDRGRAGLKAYGRTKLMNILFTRELARRLSGTGVTVNAVHPGVVATSIWSGVGGIFGTIVGFLAPFLMKTPEDGAKTSIYAATSPEIEGQTGLYFSNNEAIFPSDQAQDAEVARHLWEISAQMTGLES